MKWHVEALVRRRLRWTPKLAPVCFSILVWSAGVLFGQGGANYSVFGLGQQRNTFGAAYESVGGAAVAVRSDYLFGIANPALWAHVKSTRIQGGYRFNQQRIEQGGLSTDQNNGKLDGASALFALDTSLGIAVSIGVFPSSSVNYASRRRFQITLPEIGLVDGATTYRGAGGMTTAYAGGALYVGNGMTLGAALLYGFGLISDQTESELATESAQRALSTTNDILSSLGGRIGLYVELGGGFSGGIALASWGRLHVERSTRYQSLLLGILTPSFDTSFANNLTSTMPSTVAAGLSYSYRRWLAVTEAEYTVWKDFNYRYRFPAQPGDSYRFALGLSYQGSRSAGASLEDRITFNGGIGMMRLPVLIHQRALEDYYASIGMQIPFGGAAMIDAALIGGIRGTDLEVREQYFRLSITLSVGEVWFIPFRR